MHWWDAVDFKYQKPKAFCHSKDCNKDGSYFRGHNSEKKVEKNVPISENFCPDCKEALVWSKEFIGGKKHE